jgi:hypothetical protein
MMRDVPHSIKHMTKGNIRRWYNKDKDDNKRKRSEQTPQQSEGWAVKRRLGNWRAGRRCGSWWSSSVKVGKDAGGRMDAGATAKVG